MKIRLFVLLIALCFVCQCAGAAKRPEVRASTVKPSQDLIPTIHFLRPMKGERFFDYPIFVQVEISDFHLVAPDMHQSASIAPNVGHIEYSLDDYPAYATNDTQIMIGKHLGNGYIPVGFHILKAQLVDVSNHALSPPAIAVTQVFSEHPAPIETAHAPGGSPQAELAEQTLYQLRVHLQELQKDLARIKTGNFGYTPTPMTGKENSTE